MSGAFEITFKVLNHSRNARAIDTLIAALNVPSVRYQEAAIQGLVNHNNTRGHLEVFRRYSDWDEPFQDIVHNANAKKISNALNQGILHGEPDLKQTCLRLAEIVEVFDVVPILIQLLEEYQDNWTNQVVATLKTLVTKLYEHCHRIPGKKPDGKSPPRNVTDVSAHFLTELDAASVRLTDHTYLTELVECILILGDPDNYLVEKTLSHSPKHVKTAAADLLTESTHAGVMDLICASMRMNYPQRQLWNALQTRKDPEFVCHVLRWYSSRLSPICQQHLQQTKSLAWISEEDLQLSFIPPGLQERLVNFVQATGIHDDDKMNVFQWLINHGAPEGRLAAADAITKLDTVNVKDVIYGGLESDDVEVKAWATGQLRSQGLPDASARLVDMLDCPETLVRDVAREQLESFNLEFMLKNFEQIDDAVCERAAQVIQKIDPECISQLIQELLSPVNSHRAKAALAASKMGLVRDVVPAILEMLDDTDPLIRRVGIQVLADVPSQSVRSAVEPFLDDPSARVRDAAKQTLRTIDEELKNRESLRHGNATPN